MNRYDGAKITLASILIATSLYLAVCCSQNAEEIKRLEKKIDALSIVEASFEDGINLRIDTLESYVGEVENRVSAVETTVAD